MSRLFTCGGEENDTTFTGTMWSAVIGAVTYDTNSPHSGTYSLRFNAAGAAVSLRRDAAPGFANGETYTLRRYFKFDAAPSANAQILRTSSVGGSEIIVCSQFLLTNRQLRLGTSGSLTVTALSTGTWYRIETEVFVADAGYHELRLYLGDSTTALDTVRDNVDTLSVSNTGRWEMGVISSVTLACNLDDIALNHHNASGFQDGSPGPGKTTLRTVGSNVTTEWEDDTSGSSRFNNVDELPGNPNDVTDFNTESVTLNSIDRFGSVALPAEVPSTAQIVLVDLYARVGSDQGSAASMRLKTWDDGGNLTNGPAISIAINGWKILTTSEHQVSNTTGKSKAQVGSYNYGYENITETATRARRVSTLWANVEWIEASVADNPETPSVGAATLTGVAASLSRGTVLIPQTP